MTDEDRDQWGLWDRCPVCRGELVKSGDKDDNEETCPRGCYSATSSYGSYYVRILWEEWHWCYLEEDPLSGIVRHKEQLAAIRTARDSLRMAPGDFTLALDCDPVVCIFDDLQYPQGDDDREP